MSVEMLFFVLLLVMCGVVGYLAIPRVLRRWSVTTKPTDERLEYAAHLGGEVDHGPSEVGSSQRERAGHHEIEGSPLRQL